MQRPASNTNKDPYEVTCHIRAQCGEGRGQNFGDTLVSLNPPPQLTAPYTKAQLCFFNTQYLVAAIMCNTIVKDNISHSTHCLINMLHTNQDWARVQPGGSGLVTKRRWGGASPVLSNLPHQSKKWWVPLHRHFYPPYMPPPLRGEPFKLCPIFWVLGRVIKINWLGKGQFRGEGGDGSFFFGGGGVMEGWHQWLSSIKGYLPSKGEMRDVTDKCHY